MSLLGFDGIVRSSATLVWPAMLVVKVALLLAAALIVTRLTRGASPTARHRLFVYAVIAGLCLPVLELLTPSWSVPVFRIAPSGSRMPLLIDDVDRAPGAAEFSEVAGAVPRERTNPIRTVAGETRSVWRRARGALARVRAPGVLAVCYLLGLAGVFLSTLLAYRRTWGLRREAGCPRDAQFDRIARSAARAAGLGAPVQCRIAMREVVPMATGLFRPCVILPAESSGWAAGRLRRVLLHEFAHIARRDLIAAALARVLCALHWFNPLAWIVAARMTFERERACDEAVVAAGVRPDVYASDLLLLASRLNSNHGCRAAVSMARRTQLEGRLVHILETPSRRIAAARFETLIPAIMVWAVAIPIASLRLFAQTPSDFDETQLEVQLDHFGEPLTLGWDAARFVEALRSRDREQRELGERGIASLPAESPVRDEVVDILAVRLTTGSEQDRHAAAWQLSKTKSDRAFDLLAQSLSDESELVRKGAAGAMGELGDPRAIESLPELRDDPSAEVREWAARSLGEYRGPAATEALRTFANDPAANVREWGVRSLSQVTDGGATDLMIDRLSDESPQVREWAVRSLQAQRDPRAVEPLIETLAGDEPEVQEWAARVLGSYEDRRAVQPLADALSAESSDVREWAARGLGSLGDPAAIDALEAATRDTTLDVREWATRSLGWIDDPRAASALTRVLDAGPEDVREWAVRGLGARGGEDALDALERALRSAAFSDTVRAEAARMLGRQRDGLSLDPLLGALSAESPEVREEVLGALANLDAEVGRRSAEESMVGDPSARVRRAAAEVIGTLGAAGSEEALASALADPSEEVAAEAARALSGSDSAVALDALIEGLTSGDVERRRQLVEALVAAGTPTANAALEAAIERGGPGASLLRDWMDEAQRRYAPSQWFAKRFPNEDPWLILARVFIDRYDLDSPDALELARNAIRRREQVEKKFAARDPKRSAALIEKIKKDFLVANLERMARRSSKTARRSD